MRKYEIIQVKKAADRRRHREEKKMSGEGGKAPAKYGYRQLSIPGEVLDELKTVKEKYEQVWGGRMSYGDVISRLMAAAKRYDPEVFAIPAADVIDVITDADIDEVEKRWLYDDVNRRIYGSQWQGGEEESEY